MTGVTGSDFRYYLRKGDSDMENKSLKLAVALFACSTARTFAAETAGTTLHVSGTGTDLLNSAIIHSKKSTSTGEIQKSTEIVELQGDLTGGALPHHHCG